MKQTTIEELVKKGRQLAGSAPDQVEKRGPYASWSWRDPAGDDETGPPEHIRNAANRFADAIETAFPDVRAELEFIDERALVMVWIFDHPRIKREGVEQ